MDPFNILGGALFGIVAAVVVTVCTAAFAPITAVIPVWIAACLLFTPTGAFLAGRIK